MKTLRTNFLSAFVAVGVVLGGAIAFSGAHVEAEDAPVVKDERFFMLNVLWFNEDGGEAKYAEYVAAATPFVAKHGGKSDGAYIPGANIIGKFDADLIFFVEWPNFKAFTEFARDPGYQAVAHLRTEAIRDSLLIRCERVEP